MLKLSIINLRQTFWTWKQTCDGQNSFCVVTSWVSHFNGGIATHSASMFFDLSPWWSRAVVAVAVAGVGVVVAAEAVVVAAVVQVVVVVVAVVVVLVVVVVVVVVVVARSFS